MNLHQDIFENYKREYGVDSYLKIISQDYEKNPELVLIQPEQFNPTEYVDIDVRNVFKENLSCNACSKVQTKDQLTQYEQIFEDPKSVKDLINYIGRFGQNASGLPGPDSNCVYSYLQKMGAPTNGKGLHSELWFLPDKDLYSDYFKFLN